MVFDPVGGDAFDEARQCVANEGRIVVVGFAGGRIQTLRASHLLMHNYTVMGLYMGALHRTAEDREYLQQVHAGLLDLLAAGRIHPVVDRVIELADAPGALADLAAGRTVGKIVVRL